MNFNLVFKCLPLGDLLFIISHLLLETPIIINSENQALLGATILTLLALMKPFKWPHPVIFSLPSEKSGLVDSPTISLIGLNFPKSFVEELFKKQSPREDAILIDLDLNEYTYEPSRLSSYKKLKIKERTEMQFVQGEYMKYFCADEPQHARRLVNHERKKRSILECSSTYETDEKSTKVAQKIIRHLNAFLEQVLVNNLPEKKLALGPDGRINMKVIESHILGEKNQSQKQFLESMLKTQLYEMFLESFYK